MLTHLHINTHTNPLHINIHTPRTRHPSFPQALSLLQRRLFLRLSFCFAQAFSLVLLQPIIPKKVHSAALSFSQIVRQKSLSGNQQNKQRLNFNGTVKHKLSSALNSGWIVAQPGVRNTQMNTPPPIQSKRGGKKAADQGCLGEQGKICDTIWTAATQCVFGVRAAQEAAI